MISAESVSKYYGDRCVLNNISIKIERGECLGIVGQNGAGKTTLIQIILSLLKPSSGRVKYDFKREQFPWKIGVQLQDGSFDDLLKVNEICYLFCRVYKLPFSRADELLSTFNMLHCKKTRATKLSGGEKQKLNILLSILHNPEFLFFDELTTGLDAPSRSKIFEILKREKGNERTIILVSHYFEEIWSICENVLVLKNGDQLFMGSKYELGTNELEFKQNISKMIESSEYVVETS